jgi:hypothetical protein
MKEEFIEISIDVIKLEIDPFTLYKSRGIRIPMINVDFIGKVDKDLIPGVIYLDNNFNSFIATDVNEIRNYKPVLNSFIIPKCITPILSAFIEKSNEKK